MKLENHNFIGIFDSGIGGISVLNSCISLMPNENYVYFADSKNFPYGIKSKDELINIGSNALSQFYKLNAKEVIIACNTISTNVKETLDKKFSDLHIIGTYPNFAEVFSTNTTIKETLIQYSKEEGLTIKRNKLKLLIIATTGTCKSPYLSELINEYNNVIDIYVEPADFIVTAVEKCKLDTIEFKNEIETLFKEYKDIDCLFLGCTHFPHAINEIRSALNDKVKIISGSNAAAKSAYDYLNNNNILDYNSNPHIHIIDESLDDSRKQLFYKLINTNNQIIFHDNFDL